MGTETIIRGVLSLHSETGTEGGWWALQDEKHIVTGCTCVRSHYAKVVASEPHEHWSYDGLNYLEDGDLLKIFNPDGTIYWEGEIVLKQHDVFTQEAFGFWIHADHAKLDRKFWATPFFEGYKAELTKKAKA